MEPLIETRCEKEAVHAHDRTCVCEHIQSGGVLAGPACLAFKQLSAGRLGSVSNVLAEPVADS